MNILETIDGTVLDKYAGEIFGEKGQLKILGIFPDERHSRQCAVECSVCKQDIELFSTGIFKASIGHLSSGKYPCGCSKRPKWEQWQLEVIARRSLCEKGYKFVKFDTPYKGRKTPCFVECPLHGIWRVGIAENVLNKTVICHGCLVEKRDSAMIESFRQTNNFPENTKFWRSSRVDKNGSKNFWWYWCGECKQTNETRYISLKEGSINCDCSRNSRTNIFYLSLIKDADNPIALKFGITNNPKRRIKEQSFSTIYTIELIGQWLFKEYESALNCEKVCKSLIFCGVLPKEEFKDGFSETTYISNLQVIIDNVNNLGGEVYNVL